MMARFSEYYLPYTVPNSRNKDPYLVWDSAFEASDGHNYHNSFMGASIESHRPASLNHYCIPQTPNVFPNCSSSSSSWSRPEKRKCCGLSFGCCVLTVLALIIIFALLAIVCFSVYLAMITRLRSSDPAPFTANVGKNTKSHLHSTVTTTTNTPLSTDLLSSSTEQPFSESNSAIDSSNILLKRMEISEEKAPELDFGLWKPIRMIPTTSAPPTIPSPTRSLRHSPTTDPVLMVDGFLVPSISVPKTANEDRLPKYIPHKGIERYPYNDIMNEGVGATNEDIIDQNLFEEQTISIMNESMALNVTNLDPLTTTSLSPCMQNEFKCDSGQCLSANAHCNRRIECKDGSDEVQCTCALYLKAEHQFEKLCDGVIDCYDSSDEMNCSYCKDNYICADSHVCIDKSKVCDGDNDCPNGDDESECISLIPHQNTTNSGYLNSEGSLYVRREGEWAPICLDDLNIANDLDIQHNTSFNELWRVEDLGRAICRANSYEKLNSVHMISLNNSKFFTIKRHNENITPSLSVRSLFEKSECLSKRTAYVKCKDFECGVRADSISSRIVGGQSASQPWPWQVALYREGEFQCGGVIISSQWLITAAHCFHGTQSAYWTARFGILRRGNVFASPHEQLRRITHILVHNHYVDKGFINDIALLRLDSPINYSKHVRPICMPSQSDDVSKWHRQLCTTVGWGKLFEHGRIFPDTLQEVKLPVISTEECRKRTLFLPLYKITDNMFCAGYDTGGKDACLGDSGGPLMCQKGNGKWFLLGVTSNGDGCGRAAKPGVYTKVANYKDWIEKIINSELEPEIKRPCDGLRCPLGRCLKREHICNGIMDCRDASDEQNCQNIIGLN